MLRFLRQKKEVIADFMQKEIKEHQLILKVKLIFLMNFFSLDDQRVAKFHLLDLLKSKVNVKIFDEGEL